jgi:hypothetical protein
MTAPIILNKMADKIAAKVLLHESMAHENWSIKNIILIMVLQCL